MPYFFLSHAPDEDEIFVERFFDDLSAEVRRRAGAGQNLDVGFLDATTRGGPLWPVDARIALTTCQTFISLCSAKYFLSSSCGRAWGIFVNRLRRHEVETGVQASALIPVIWASDGFPPDAFQEECVEITPHQTPGDEDLRVLVRMRSERAQYRAFVSSLAHRVVEVAHTQRLPAAPPGTDIDAAVDAFEVRPRWGSAVDPPQRVYFIVAAGTRAQMQAVRENLQFYGDSREDWTPFRPTSVQPLATYARGVAARRLLGSEVVPIDGIESRLAAARERNEIVVLLVDSWATQLEPLRRTLHDVARRNDAEFAVLVPASRDDPETTSHGGMLRSAVLNTFSDHTRHGNAMFRMDIETVDGFDDDLANALTAAQLRVYRSGRVFRRLSARQPGARPILGGP